jgi:arylsulfatase A-like enzyme
MRDRRSLARLACLLSLLGLGACDSTCGGTGERPGNESAVLTAKGKPKFDVLVVVLDACRADKFGAYGFERDTTPHTDRLAADPDAVVFRHHYSQGAWTKPSTASLFTGLLVRQHGVSRGHERVEIDGQATKFRIETLGDEHVTMAEVFREAGYATVGVVNNSMLVPYIGYAQGFDQYHAPDSFRGSDRQHVAKLLHLLPKRPQRFFAYLHLHGCHYPFQEKRRDRDYLTRHGFPYDEGSRRAAGVDFAQPGFALRDAIRAGTLQLNEDDVRYLHLLYESQLHRLDAEVVAPLFQALQEAKIYDDTLILVTADHGEELYDHLGYAHDYALWNEIIHVPLIVKFPRGRKPAALKRRVDDVTSTVDLMPSLLSLLGQTPPATLAGSPALLGRFTGYALAELGYVDAWALMQGRDKLIDGARGTFLFDLADDPHERINLAGQRPDRVEEMRVFVRALRQGDGTNRPAAPMIESELHPAAIERLRSLGYLK